MITLNWPLLKVALLVALWQVAGAANDPAWKDGNIKSEIELELLDPPSPPSEDWRKAYGNELSNHPGIHLDLAHENPVARIARRARLSPAEEDVCRLLFRGASLSATARALRRQKRTVSTLQKRAEWKLAELARKRGAAHEHSRPGTERP